MVAERSLNLNFHPERFQLTEETGENQTILPTYFTSDLQELQI